MCEENTKRRVLHYDLLRILAAFSVVMLHSAAQHWYVLDIYSKEWVIANSYDAVFRFGVPIFVMISGALFLSPKYQLDISRLYKHNILRYVVIYVVWSCIYGLWDTRTWDFAEAGWKPVFRELLYGRYHLWFLPMIIGIYIILPILRTWILNADQKNLQYFLSLFFILQIGRETFRALTVTDELHYALDLVQVELVCGYIGYFVWGYYLAHIGLSKKVRKWFYICFIPAIIANVVLGNVLAHHYGVVIRTVYDSFGVFTFCVVSALFLMAQDIFGEKQFSKRTEKVIKELSAGTLGVYLMHLLIIAILELVGVDSMSLPNIIGIPFLAVLCYVIATILAVFLRRIPVIGKYIC